MPAGANGKLYGAVTTHVIADTLSKAGFEIERKRIDLPGSAIKTVGSYKAIIKLYESQTAEIHVNVKAQEVAEEKTAKSAKGTKASKAAPKDEPKAEEVKAEEAPAESAENKAE